MNTKPLFILLVLPALLLTITISIPAHAETVYLDSDAPTILKVQMKPGDYAKFKLPWDVTFSSIHGDDENKDSEIVAAGVDIHVHLGNDNVLVTVTDDGKKQWEKEIAHQDGFHWSEHEHGTVAAELLLDCYGNLHVYINNDEVYTKSGIDTGTTLQVYGDNDASLEGHGTYYTCGTTAPPDYQPTKLADNNKAIIALGGLSVLGTLATVLALRR